MAGVLNQFGGLMFGAQVGQGLAGLAREIVSGADVGLPLGVTGVAALLPENVTVFGAGLERPADEVRLYLALREAAHHRLFAHVPWLRQRLLDTIDAYARGIAIDTSAIERAMGEIDPNNPESIQEALSGGMFTPEQTPEQEVALRRLGDSARPGRGLGRRRGPGRGRRSDARRRRPARGLAASTGHRRSGRADVLDPGRARAAAPTTAGGGGPVVGRDQQHGVSGRDGVWAHPDLLPTADDLDDPLGFAERMSADDGDPLEGLSKSIPSGPSSSRSVVELGLGGSWPWFGQPGAEAVEVPARPLGAWILLDQRPEPRAVAGDLKVGQLMHQYVVEHPVGD